MPGELTKGRTMKQRHQSTGRLLATLALSVVMAGFISVAPGCNSGSKGDGQLPKTQEELAAEAIQDFIQTDPGMQRFFDDAHGYVVFPNVAKGAVIIGGARGDGVVYENGAVIGYSTLTQGTVGAQLGGQAYREVIFFADEASMSHFKQGKFEFSAQASAVAAREGASANADYASGIAVFTIAKGGLMFEASIGGQELSYRPR